MVDMGSSSLSTVEDAPSNAPPSTTVDTESPSSTNGIRHHSTASGTCPIHEEYQYLNLIREIINDGEHRPDRYVTLLFYIHARIAYR